MAVSLKGMAAVQPQWPAISVGGRHSAIFVEAGVFTSKREVARFIAALRSIAEISLEREDSHPDLVAAMSVVYEAA